MCKRLWFFLLCLSFCAGCAVNPITGEEELMLFPIEQDITIGREYAPEVAKQLGGEIDNPPLQNYINYVGQKVARVSHNRVLEYHFTAVEDKTINAVALPGGYIFITRGMLENLQTEAQLAAILAHEMVHIVARDSSNMMSNEIGISILLSVATSGETSEGVLVAADLARQIIGLRYSREDEHQADLGGLDYMVWAGYNPYGMVETMQILLNQNETRPVEFFSTHPSPENRIAYLMQKIQTKYNYNITELKIGKEDYRRSVSDRLND